MAIAKYVTRAQWGARPATRRDSLPISSVSTLFVHYTGMDADEQADHKNCAARVKGVQNYHMDHNGWNDIAYNFLVCKHGYVFEGRGFDTRSAATGDCNGFSWAICFLGDDTVNRDDVSPDGRAALARIVAEIERRKGRALVLKGHRECGQTSCPGNELHAYVHSETFRKAINNLKNPPKFYAVLVTKDGKVHDRSTAVVESRLKARVATFTARVAPKIAVLAFKRKNPRIGIRKV